MISANEALRLILEAAPRLGAEKVRLSGSLGRVLASDVVAEMHLPPFDNSSMDGYAVRAEDTVRAAPETPVSLSVMGEAPAGSPYRGSVRRGETVRIMTGGRIPEGADAVIPVESVQAIDDTRIRCNAPITAGANIRRTGEDVAKGELVLQAGEVIGPSRMAVLAALGHARVRVRTQPRVNILATGNELVKVSEEPAGGQIRNSSSVALAGQVTMAGGVPHVLGIVPDKKKRLKKAIREGLDADVLLVTGGVSVGKYDYVRSILEGLGVTLGFWKVNIKPGKPLLFGYRKRTMVFGLPGNPVSTGVTFLEFVRPCLWRMMDRRDDSILIPAKIAHSFSKADDKRHYLRGVLQSIEGELWVATTGTQSSGAMSSMAKANCLMLIPEQVRRLVRGETVHVRLLET